MFDHSHYVPILRWKQGEQIALRELYPRDKASMTPLVEVPRGYSRTTDQAAEVLARNWGTSPIFVDLGPFLSWLVPSKRTKAFSGLFKMSRNLGLNAIPVTGINRIREYRDSVRQVVAEDRRGACFRLSRKDLSSPSLDSELESETSFLGLEPTSIDLVLDLQIFDEAVQNYSDFFRRIPSLHAWRTFTLVSGAFPEDLTGLSVGQHTLSRSDWMSWRDQVAGVLPRLPTYGDYGTLHPFLKPDMVGLNPSASIRYTADEYRVVMRGEGLRNKSGTGHAQYPANSELLTIRPEYCGQYFSFGDNYIYEVSLNKGKTGNPRTCVTAGVNHHLTFVTRQIKSLVGDPTQRGLPLNKLG